MQNESLNLLTNTSSDNSRHMQLDVQIYVSDITKVK